jgi:hypothetical protein
MVTDLEEYEVFKGSPKAKPFRLGSVRGSERATQLMYRMYARLPGDYFIRQTSTEEVIISVQRQCDLLSVGKEPTFDIFRGVPEKNAVWIDAAEGLLGARERMEQIARVEPGRYFVFSRLDHSVLAYVEKNMPVQRSATQAGTVA